MAESHENISASNSAEAERSYFAQLQADQQPILEASGVATKARVAVLQKQRYEQTENSTEEPDLANVEDRLNRSRIVVAEYNDKQYIRFESNEMLRSGPAMIHYDVPVSEMIADAFLPMGEFTDDDVLVVDGLLDKVKEAEQADRLPNLFTDFASLDKAHRNY